MTVAFKDAGAKIVAKGGASAAGQATAEVAAATGTPVGALVATAVEGGVLVMNVNDAVTVAQIGADIVKQYGPMKATQIMAGAIGSGVQTMVSQAGAGAMTSLDGVGPTLGMPPGPPRKP